MSRLVDEEFVAGKRVFLVEVKDPEFWPCGETPTGQKRYIHACIIDEHEGMLRCTICGDFIPVPIGLRI